MRKALTPQEILELDQALIEAFALYKAFRSRVSIARYIKFPQIPAILGESLVITAADRLFGISQEANFGGALSDVRLVTPTGQTRRVEVKATAVMGSKS